MQLEYSANRKREKSTRTGFHFSSLESGAAVCPFCRVKKTKKKTNYEINVTEKLQLEINIFANGYIWIHRLTIHFVHVHLLAVALLQLCQVSAVLLLCKYICFMVN